MSKLTPSRRPGCRTIEAGKPPVAQPACHSDEFENSRHGARLAIIRRVSQRPGAIALVLAVLTLSACGSTSASPKLTSREGTALRKGLASVGNAAAAHDRRRAELALNRFAHLVTSDATAGHLASGDLQALRRGISQARQRIAPDVTSVPSTTTTPTAATTTTAAAPTVATSTTSVTSSPTPSTPLTPAPKQPKQPKQPKLPKGPGHAKAPKPGKGHGHGKSGH